MASAISAAVDALTPFVGALFFLIGKVTVDVLSWDRSASFVQFSFGSMDPGVVTEIVFAAQAPVLLRFAPSLILVGSFVSALEQDLLRCVRPPVGLAGGAARLALANIVSNLAKDLLGLSNNWFRGLCGAAIVR